METLDVSRKSIGTRSYLVHIYRNASDFQTVLAGTVEQLGSNTKQRFHTVSEFLQLLNLNAEEPGGQDND